MRYIYSLFGTVFIIFGIYTTGIYLDLYGELEDSGDSINSELPKSQVREKLISQKPLGREKQI